MDLLLCSTPTASAVLVDARSGGQLHTLKDCRPAVHGLCASGSFVLTAERGRSFVHAWSWRKEQPRYRCQAPERITCLTCTADGAHAVGGGVSGKLYLWQLATGRLLLAWDAHFKPPTALTCALGDGFLLSAGEDAIVLAWNFASLLHAASTHSATPPSPVRTWTEHTLPIAALCVAACGQHDLLASASADQTVRIWRLADSARGCVHAADFPCALTAVAAHPRHSCLYAGGADGVIYPMPLLAETAATTGARTAAARTSTAHTGALRALSVSADGARLFSCATDPGLRVWDAHTLALLQVCVANTPRRITSPTVIEATEPCLTACRMDPRRPSCVPLSAAECPRPQVLQPSTVFEAMLSLRRRPDDLAFAGSLAEEAGAVASGGAGGSAANGGVIGGGGGGTMATLLLAPLKKFVDAPPEEAEASARTMGCVPCELTADGSAAWLAPMAFEDELPLLTTLPPNSHDHVLQPGGGSWRVDEPAFGTGGLADGGRALAAEATVCQLRAQLQQLQEINRELYAMATDATLGMA